MRTFRVENYPDLQGLREELGWNFWSEEELSKEVREIIARVKGEGDAALHELTLRFDHVDLEEAGLRVGEKELAGAEEKVEPKFKEAVRTAAKSIFSFHRRQKWESRFWDSEEGARVGQMVRPLHRVGIYVPGGEAAYPSTAMMTVIPARVAGVHEIAVCIPPKEGGAIDPHTLFVLHYLNVKEVYRLGGAQAVAALALGTETIPAVEKVVGPGNIYVTLAKKEVYGRVGIDMLAGPSELVVLADGNASPELVAWDMAAQMEHGAGAKACLITDSEDLVRKVERELEGASSGLPPLQPDAAVAVIVNDMEEGVRVVDHLAPEHLLIASDDITDLSSKIHNVGTVFLGQESPVALGDYAVGVNHVLPTRGAARYASPLGVYDFLKTTNVVFSNPRANRSLADAVMILAEVEGLGRHAESMRRRLQ